MAIVIEANYSKKLGLPNFSSHQFSVTVRTELTDINQVEAECARLYKLLQDSVDHEIQVPGFLPDELYGVFPQNHNGNQAPSTPTSIPHHRPHQNGNGHSGNSNTERERWMCSDKQREYIQRIVRENELDKDQVENLAIEMHGNGVKALTRMQASGLIDELLERHGGGKPRNGQSRQRGHFANGGNGGPR